METQELIKMLAEGSVDTLYMTLVSTALAYVIGFPMGIALIVTRKDGLKPMPAVNRILDIFVNILRSIFDLVDRSDPSDKTDCRKKLWLYRYDCPARYCSGTIYCAYDRVFFVGSRTRCCGGCVKYGSFPA